MQQCICDKCKTGIENELIAKRYNVDLRYKEDSGIFFEICMSSSSKYKHLCSACWDSEIKILIKYLTEKP